MFLARPAKSGSFQVVSVVQSNAGSLHYSPLKRDAVVSIIRSDCSNAGCHIGEHDNFLVPMLPPNAIFGFEKILYFTHW